MSVSVPRNQKSKYTNINRMRFPRKTNIGYTKEMGSPKQGRKANVEGKQDRRLFLGVAEARRGMEKRSETLKWSRVNAIDRTPKYWDIADDYPRYRAPS